MEELRKQHSVMVGDFRTLWHKLSFSVQVCEVKCLRQIVHHDGHLDLYLRCQTQHPPSLSSACFAAVRWLHVFLQAGPPKGRHETMRCSEALRFL